jgi:DDE superfamily endonuclease
MRPPGPHPGHEPQGHRARGDRGDSRGVGVTAGPPPRSRVHRPAGPARRDVPAGPVIVVICDNDSTHDARKVTAYVSEHTRLELLYGARYSPRDNPGERIWAALKNDAANTAVSWPGRCGRYTSFSATAHQIRCWPPPRLGPTPGCHRVTNRTIGMPLLDVAGGSTRRRSPLVPACCMIKRHEIIGKQCVLGWREAAANSISRPWHAAPAQVSQDNSKTFAHLGLQIQPVSGRG